MKHQLQMVSEVKMGRTYQCIHNITVQFNYIFEELIEKNNWKYEYKHTMVLQYKYLKCKTIKGNTAINTSNELKIQIQGRRGE